jgi:hypothetical protein
MPSALHPQTIMAFTFADHTAIELPLRKPVGLPAGTRSSYSSLRKFA